MIQCRDCEFFRQKPDGSHQFLCDPFSTIKEPECLIKWQLIKLDTMVRSYQATLSWYERLAPLQEKMFRHMEREVDDLDAADQWKYGSLDTDEDPEPNDDDENPPR